MRITDITAQRKSESRVNIFLDTKYWLSLDIAQVVELGIKVGKEISERDKQHIEQESGFGKAYAAALNLISIRVRSIKEIRDYAWRKKWEPDITDRVIERLESKKYLNDQHFASRWVDARAHLKPLSKRKIQAELQQKGVKNDDVNIALLDYDELSALRRMVQKKRAKYDDDNKLIQYLMRQGFKYGDIKEVLMKNKETSI